MKEQSGYEDMEPSLFEINIHLCLELHRIEEKQSEMR